MVSHEDTHRTSSRVRVCAWESGLRYFLNHGAPRARLCGAPRLGNGYDSQSMQEEATIVEQLTFLQETNIQRSFVETLDIGFLQKCKLFNFFPKFLHFKLSTREFHDTNACHRFRKELLSFEIRLIAKVLENGVIVE